MEVARRIQLACISKKGGARNVLVRSSHISVGIASEADFVCSSTIRRSYTRLKNRNRMHSPSYDLPRETLPMREEAERRPNGTTHALRSIGRRSVAIWAEKR